MIYFFSMLELGDHSLPSLKLILTIKIVDICVKWFHLMREVHIRLLFLQ